MTFEWGKQTYVMGILNVTPDSFSGDGLMGGNAIDTAVVQAEKFVADGADILDIGGQSTRPGSQPIDADDEIKRVVPVIKAVRQAVDVPISVDTYWAKVADAALDAGASWVNDVWGFKMDPDIAKVAAAADCPLF